MPHATNGARYNEDVIGVRFAFVIVVAAVVSGHSIAHAGPLAVVDAHAEADVADEGSAVTLLVRHALTRPERPLLDTTATMQGPAWTTRNAAARSKQLGVDAVVLLDVAREGTGLIATVLVVTPAGKVSAAAARAGDGNISGLAEGVVGHIKNVTGARVNTVPSASLGELQPFTNAERVLQKGTDRETVNAAMQKLLAADPLVALRVTAIAERLRPLLLPPGDDVAASPRLTTEQHLLAMRLLATPSELAYAATSTPAALGKVAAVFAEVPVDKLRALDGALQGSRDPIAKFARAVIAQRRDDTASRDKLLLELLGSPLQPMAMAWATTLSARSLSPALHKALLAAAEQLAATAPGLTSKIGLAAAEAGVDKDRAMALISVAELNDIEIGRLEPMLPAVSERVLLRLKAELAIRRNDDSQIAAITSLVSDAPGEARGHLYQGRQLMSDKLYREAASEFAKAGATLEHARALALAGDLKEALKLANSIGVDNTAEFLTVQASIALANGDFVGAQAAIDRAESAAPASAQVNRTIVTVATKSPNGDPNQAAAVRTIATVADTLAPTTTSAAANAATPTVSTGVKADETPQARMATELVPLLDMMPTLLSLPSKDIVLAEIGWHVPFYSLRDVKSDVVRTALSEALARAPWGLRVVPEVPTRQNEPIERSTLRALTGSHAGVLFYQVQADGGQARVRLLLFPQGATEGVTATRSVNSYDAVSWDVTKLAAIAVVVVLLVGWFMLLIIRGNGDIDVRYKLDADSKDEVFGIVIAKTPTRPSIGDVKKFFQETPKAGQKIDKRRAILIGGQTKFRVPPGPWTVTLYGVYDRADNLVELPATTTKSVDVRRGKTEFVTFDLIPKDAELRINIHGKQQRGIAVWLNADRDNRVFTDAQGNANLRCNLGSHVLYAEYEGKVFDRKLQVAAPRIERISLNIERELMLASVAGVDAALPAKSPASVPAAVVRFSSGASPAAASANAVTAPDVATAETATGLLDLGELDLSDFASPSATPPPAASAAPTKKEQTGINIADLMNASAPANATAFLPDTGAGAAAKPASGGFFEPVTPRPATNKAAEPLLPASKPKAPTTAANSPSGILSRANANKELLLGRYEMRQELGRGAMGVVYRAYDTNLERDVAIKSLARELRSHPDALRMFQQEAKALAQMNHGNIVSVFDQVNAGDETYLIMEFVDGRTLDDILRDRGIFPWMEAAAMIDNICAGLAYAHGRAVIHRDIKPANIFVGKDRSVKLGDFGLARVVREMSIRKTEIRGTPLYMAPEQITGRDIDARADLYAVGCTFFELVTGRPPFIEGEILYAQLNEKPPNPMDLNPDVPPKIAELILQMIAKAAADRPANADAVRTELRKITSLALLG
jgi:hypothetical protein